MTKLTLSRRDLLAAATAIGAAGLIGGIGRTALAQSATRAQPAGDEFIVKNAYVVTMDPALGEIANGDIHVRDGAIVSVGRNLSAPGARVVSGETMIACPGFIETHWHMWGAVARNMSGHTEDSGYYYVS